MKLSTMINKLNSQATYWKTQGWGDPSISEIIVDSDYVYISFCHRKVFDKQLRVTVHKKPSTKVILRGKF